MREIAATAIIEVTALARLQRADRHKTVAAIGLAEHTVGDLVDIWYEPSTKDVSGWRGPAQIATINDSDGNITVRFQGRTLDRKHQEVRYPISYFVYCNGSFAQKADAFMTLANYMESTLKLREFTTIGMIYKRGWIQTELHGAPTVNDYFNARWLLLRSHCTSRTSY